MNNADRRMLKIEIMEVLYDRHPPKHNKGFDPEEAAETILSLCERALKGSSSDVPQLRAGIADQDHPGRANVPAPAVLRPGVPGAVGIAQSTEQRPGRLAGGPDRGSSR